MDKIPYPTDTNDPTILKPRESYRDSHATVANDTPELRRMKARERYRNALIKLTQEVAPDDRTREDIAKIFDQMLEEDRRDEGRQSPVKGTRKLSTRRGFKVLIRRASPTVAYPVYLDDIIGVFDPGRETISAAIERLMSTVKHDLRTELERIADDDRACVDVESAHRLPDDISFQRLARYHLLGETFYKIAKDEAVRRDLNATDSNYQPGNVRRSIRKAAAALDHPEWSSR